MPQEICSLPFFLWEEEEEEARFSEARTWNDSRLVVFFCVLVLSSYKVHVVHLHGQPGQSLLAGQSLCGVVAGGRCGAAVLDEDEDALNCCVNQDRLWHMMPTYSWSFNFTSNPFANEEWPESETWLPPLAPSIPPFVCRSDWLCDSLPFKLGSWMAVQINGQGDGEWRCWWWWRWEWLEPALEIRL